MVTFRHLAIYITVYECKSQKQASELLFLSRQTIMTILREIEEDIGTDLYIKGQKMFKSTPCGDYFYEKSKKLIHDYNILMETSKQFRKKRISLSVNTNLLYIFPNMRKSLIEFINATSDEDILLIEGKTQDEIIHDLEKDKIDCGLVLAMGEIDGYQSFTIQKYSAVAFLNQNHPLVAETVDTTRLMEYPLICAGTPEYFYKSIQSELQTSNCIVEPQITSALQRLLQNPSAIMLGIHSSDLIKDFPSLKELPAPNCFFLLQLIWKKESLTHHSISLAQNIKP